MSSTDTVFFLSNLYSFYFLFLSYCISQDLRRGPLCLFLNLMGKEHLVPKSQSNVSCRFFVDVLNQVEDVLFCSQFAESSHQFICPFILLPWAKKKNGFLTTFAHSFFCHGQKKKKWILNHWTTREVLRILKSGKLQEAEEALLVRLTCSVRLSRPLMALKTNKGQGKWAASRNQKEQGHGTSLGTTRKPRQQVELSPGRLKSDF